VWQWCLQVGVLMVIAVALGTLMGRWAIDLTLSSMPGHLRMTHYGLPEAQLSWRSWFVTVAIALAATPLVSLVPARQAARIAIGRALRDGGGGALGKTRAGLLRRALVGLQVALASALVFGAGGAYRSYLQARDAPLGFEPAGVVQLSLHGQGDAGQRAEFLERVARGGASTPTSEVGPAPMLALVSDPPLMRWSESQKFYAESASRPTHVEMPWGKRNRVSPSYFRLLDIPLLEGRTFTDDDRADGPCVVIFSQRLARSTFQDVPAVGRRVHLPAEPGARTGWRATLPQPRRDGARPGDPTGADSEDITCQVVGVAADVHDIIDGRPGYLYLVSAQWGNANTLLVRGADAAGLSRLATELRRFDPHLAIEELPLSALVEGASFGPRIIAALFIALALVGLTLAAIGTYAMLAHAASTRRREFGLRTLLGATPAQLAWLIAVENVPIGIGGIVVGLGTVGVGLTALAGYDPGPWAYPGSGAVMLILLALATLLCVRRLLALEPGIALRRR
jgi:hypothetical protein